LQKRKLFKPGMKEQGGDGIRVLNKYECERTMNARSDAVAADAPNVA